MSASTNVAIPTIPIQVVAVVAAALMEAQEVVAGEAVEPSAHFWVGFLGAPLAGMEVAEVERQVAVEQMTTVLNVKVACHSGESLGFGSISF